MTFVRTINPLSLLNPFELLKHHNVARVSFIGLFLVTFSSLARNEHGRKSDEKAQRLLGGKGMEAKQEGSRYID